MSANAAPPETAVRRPRSVNVMIALHLLVATAITAQQTVGKARSGNYAIFRAAFGHLRNGLDLYAMYPAEQLDYYKYSPTAALMLAPFSVLPYGAGLWLWNLLNAGVLCASIVLLLPGRAATGALLIVLLEAVGAIQNTQVNALLAGLMIFALVDLQRGRIAGGAGVVAIGAAIKVFPLAAGLFGVVSPQRWRHLAWCAVVGVLFLAAPLVVTSFDSLSMQYTSWYALTQRDNAKVGMAWVGGLIELMLGRRIPHAPVQLAGILWIMATAWMARTAWPHATVRHLLLASLLIFAVIFNHMAESPTFVIAYAGIGIWWATMPRARWRNVVLGLIIVFGSIAGSDIVPRDIRVAIHGGYQVKAIVTVIGWLAVQWDLLHRLRGVDSDSD